MAVLLNKDTGLAEDLAPDQAQQALSSGTHEIPIVSPQGDLGSASHDDARRLVSQGYTQPTTDQLNQMLSKAKYSSTSQSLIGAGEQVGKGFAGPLFTGAEKALGVPSEDILGREEAKGTAEKMIEQGAGLVAGAVTGVGEAAGLEKIGQVGVEAMGLAGATNTVAKIGSVAAKAAIENAVFQGGDELGKAILSDPNQTASSAIANVGLAGLIGAGFGGALGAVPTLWESTLGPKAETFLKNIQARANGETLPLAENTKTVFDALAASGHEVAPEMRAAFSENPQMQSFYQNLLESGQSQGEALRETLKNFQGQVADNLKGVFDADGASAFEAGDQAKESILQKAQAISDGISQKYKEIMPHLENVGIDEADRTAFGEQLKQAGSEFGAKGSAAQGLFEHYAARASAQDTVAQLKKLVTEIGSDYSVARRAGDFEKARALGSIRDSIKEFQDNQVISSGKKLEAQGVDGAHDLSKNLIADKKAADKAYSQFMDHVSDIASVGKLGKVRSMGQLVEALDKVPSAKLADKLFDPKNVEGLAFLKEHFPDVLENLVKAKKSSMLESAMTGGDLKHNQLLNSVSKLPKEVRDLMFSKEEQHLIEASGSILRQSFKRANPSGTAGTLDRLWSHLPAGIGAVVGAATGHGFVTGLLLGEAGKFLGRDIPDAAKMSLLKFMGSEGAVDASAWKTAADFITKIQKGQSQIGSAAKAIFDDTAKVIPISKIPTEVSRAALEKKVSDLQKDNSPLLNVGGKIGHYMPEHAEALGTTAANAVNYLQSLKPNTTKQYPLDPDREPTAEEQHVYHTALDVAAQPLMIFDSIKKGSLLPEEMGHLNQLYPGLMPQYQKAIMEHMTNALDKKQTIPYKTKMSLSIFMGQPLDSTMTPQSIQAAQSVNAPTAPAQPSAPKPQGPHSMKNIGKLAQGVATGPQQREMQKAGLKA